MESVCLIHGWLLIVLEWPHPFIPALQSIKISISLCLLTDQRHIEDTIGLPRLNIFSFVLGASESSSCPWTFQKLSKGTSFVCV